MSPVDSETDESPVDVFCSCHAFAACNHTYTPLSLSLSLTHSHTHTHTDSHTQEKVVSQDLIILELTRKLNSYNFQYELS